MELIDFGYVRVAAISPQIRIADPDFNLKEIQKSLEICKKEKISICVFPELSVTGYTCGDLFYQEILLQKTISSILQLAKFSLETKVSFIAGFPLQIHGKIYNCAGFFHNGSILGIIPKTFLPSTNEFYEQRWFTPSTFLQDQTVSIGSEEIPIGTNLLFSCREYPFLRLGIEICEDLWAVHPPSSDLSLAGATLILNPSASPETLGKYKYRKDLVSQQSARTLCAYAYSSSGAWESSTDLVYSGHCLLYENGSLLAESERFTFSTQIIFSDFDLKKIQSERAKNTSYSRSIPNHSYRNILFNYTFAKPEKIVRTYSKSPFVPSNTNERKEHCREIFQLQSTGLARRIIASKSKTLVLGISGGLDSTLALLVSKKAIEKFPDSKCKILAVTMPGFGTTSRTKSNAKELCNALDVPCIEISIEKAVLQHFSDIGQDPNVFDVTYENSQARERTQILMDLANKEQGIVVGTGDLSELALGFCTYNADQMSMYNVNSGVPKTLVKYMIEYCAEYEFQKSVRDILIDIIETPISPELLPHEADSITQETESIVGPYLLHDFFLYHSIRNLFSPEKILFLANICFEGMYSSTEIQKWFTLFIKRFFINQFKRSAMPDGVKIGSVALSPRGDWRMPSDSSFSAWLND
jgi:NAD+ synthase (glutamine-hydrolysing)